MKCLNATSLALEGLVWFEAASQIVQTTVGYSWQCQAKLDRLHEYLELWKKTFVILKCWYTPGGRKNSHCNLMSLFGILPQTHKNVHFLDLAAASIL